MARKPAPARKTPASRPLLEWAVAGLGLVVTVGVLIVLAAAALAPASPPALSARAASVAPVAAGFRVEVEVRNSGRQTAAAVEVEGVLTPPAGAPETATATLDYVPGGGVEALNLLFRQDPRQGRLELTVRGWSEP
ncbi:MAG: hypothetical protein PSV23_12585 [Brevundimonas sp.]|uniref:hypothetical protein n=1 Tax=Brevundimonas sp. TaxID=1871086 RepID=UPI0024886884|nr:hypothetical protein [Brevundimonas sp.]MDI1327621.1 hypothetical protein [Brevundimonas sp.]